jgi:pimeloyl-ACP methyl ester carboxylesterase
MPLLERHGLTFHVQLLGEAGAPPLAMLHGLLVGSLAQWWLGAAPRLARRHRVLLADFRGHGMSSPAPSGYGLASLAGDLSELLPEAGAGPATLVGHSWGALVALRLALDSPERVARLVLVEAPLPPSNVPELEAFLSAPAAEQIAALPDPLRAAAEGTSRRGRKLVAQIARLVFQTTLVADLKREPDFSDEELGKLRCPVLLVYGDRSGCRAAGERLARVIPGAELVILPGGHFLPSDSGPALTALLEERLCPT